MLNTSLYNGEGQRIRKTDGSSTNGDYTMYFYMGGSLAFSTNSDANYITDENILDPNGTIIAGKRQDNVYNPDKPEGQYWTYHYDARGSVTNIIGTDANGALYRAENNVYDAFGKDDSGSTTPTTSIKNEVKFTGAVQDGNGLYYLSSRHYDPNTGRFLQQDTVSGDPYSPWTQNLYTYTSNNPVNYIDPTGHFLGSLFAWVGKVVVGGIVNAVVDTGIRLLTGQEVSLKTVGRSFVEGCVASAIGTGTAKLASKVTSAAGKYAINKAGGAAARTTIGIMRGDSAKDIAKSVGIGFLADNILDGASATFSKIRARRANAKTTSTKSSTTRNIRTIKGSGHRKTYNRTNKRYDVNQQALLKIVKPNRRQGVDMTDARILVGWAKEYNVYPRRIDMGHPTRSLHSQLPHLHLGPYNHIPIKRR